MMNRIIKDAIIFGFVGLMIGGDGLFLMADEAVVNREDRKSVV